MNEIKAIETIYNGYRFRSRLEARWAVFFDTLGIPYEYEKEGYDLGYRGYYLPDFWLTQQKCIIEIKPKGKINTTNGKPHCMELCWELAKLSQERILLIHGNPYKNDYYINSFKFPVDKLELCNHWEFSTGIDSPNEIWLYSNGNTIQLNSFGEWASNGADDNSKELIDAYTAARQARFEHNY